MIGKILLYILSLWLLFFLIIVVSINLPDFCLDPKCTFGNTLKFIWINNIIKFNIPVVASVFLLIIGCIGYFWFQHQLTGSVSLAIDILVVEDINYEHLVFLTTYIIPLICFNLKDIRYVITLFILLSVICIIYIETDKFYTNPTLAILGYKLYKISTTLRNGDACDVIVISRDRLVVGDKITYINIEQDRIFYGKKV
ncbi:anti-phage protein KwaA [Acinetobacter bereziniae]|uniref:anti-phage protein KwaA n=1 Tax=Acinetobacter bereziniae TaxID=106648 RepID=UPI00124F82C9|nr:anti-phage protein KwaA [Acinetobacter bereziniae]